MPPLAILPIHAADLRRRGRAEASEGVVQEDVDLVLLVDERVVVVALGALDVALAGVVVEGRVSDAAALLAAQALDAHLVLGVAKGEAVAVAPEGGSGAGGAPLGVGLLQVGVDLDLVDGVLHARVSQL